MSNLTSNNVPTIETDFLIVGAGPAGASLSCFLSRYKLKGFTISAASSTAEDPRAHLTNLSTLDALRDIGLDEACYAIGRQDEQIQHLRWCESMAGEEYARISSWGTAPKRLGDYAVASANPGLLDLPQSELEPLLVTYATTHGWKLRFDTKLLSFTRDTQTGKIKSVLRDTITGTEYHVVSKYLFGADGGRSLVNETLALPMHTKPGGITAWNILVKCDLSHLMQYRAGNLHWNVRLKSDDDWMVILRMVKPWDRWMMGAFPKDPTKTNNEWTPEQYKAVMREMAGDLDADVEILNISKWRVNEANAQQYSRDNVFCLGDAVHRHPPVNGLGSNTCVGDAFNLAWKVDLVNKGIAHLSLLETYSAERQPVGAEVVRVANYHLGIHMAILQILGVKGSGHTLEERLAGINLLSSESADGIAKRAELQHAMEDMQHEVHALGIEMGQKYFGSGIFDADEPERWGPVGAEVEDRVLHYVPTTYPGRRLPHVWLGKHTPGKLVSTQDICGKGHFALLTGVSGAQKWKAAAAKVGSELGLPIKAVSIGPMADWEDVYSEWAQKRGVEEDGAVLVRPDLFCAWRSTRRFGNVGSCTEKLRAVMRGILGWNNDRKMQPWVDRLANYGKG